jgi:hypothetical protein
LNLFGYFKEFTITATLYRSAVGAYDAAGNWVPAVSTGEPVQVLVPQPAPGEFLKLLAEGEDHSKFTSTAIPSAVGIQTGRNGAGPDELEIDGERFEVFEIGRWGRYGGFDKIILRRKG